MKLILNITCVLKAIQYFCLQITSNATFKIKSMKKIITVFVLAGILASCGTSKTNSISENKQTKNNTMSNKEKAIAFVSDALSNQNEAVLKEITREDLIQHNPYVPNGTAVVIGHMLPQLKAAGTKAEIARVFTDGDYVITHNHWKNATPFGGDNLIAFDIYRFDKDGKIAEHWDGLQPMVKETASGRSQIDGPTEVKDLDKTEENKTQVKALFDVLINGTQEEAGAALMANFDPNYKQHNPKAADGLDGFMAAMPNEQWVFTKQHKVLGEGNFVLSISEGTHKGVHSVFYDLLRLENGKIVEHWDVIQEIPTEGLANENGMFGF